MEKINDVSFVASNLGRHWHFRQRAQAIKGIQGFVHLAACEQAHRSAEVRVVLASSLRQPATGCIRRDLEATQGIARLHRTVLFCVTREQKSIAMRTGETRQVA